MRSPRKTYPLRKFIHRVLVVRPGIAAVMRAAIMWLFTCHLGIASSQTSLLAMTIQDLFRNL